LLNKGTQDPDAEDYRVSKIKAVEPEQNKILANDIKEKLTSPEFADFLKHKMGLKSIQDLYLIENMDKFVDEELFVYLHEFLVPRFEFYNEEIDYEEIENRNRNFKEKLLEYFSELSKVNIKKVSKLAIEELYTLKQFLKDKYLSPTDVKRLLKETDFKAAYSNVNDKVKRLHKLGFLEAVHPTGGGYFSKFDARSEYYKLYIQWFILRIKRNP
jgi:hypothetical protein